jgi:putative methionine-R-sulfoxide reductase with GAF domain
VRTKELVTEEKNKPVLDEQTFGKLLEAAYVLQEHNREMQLLEASLELHSERLRQMEEAEAQAAAAVSLQPAEEPPQREADYTLTLAEIVEAQNQIQIRHLEKDDAMALVAERIMRITRASGAGIGILEEKTVRYRAGAGASALPVGSEAPLAKAICSTCIRTGQVLRTPDVNTEFLFDPDLCRSRGILSLAAVPVYHNGEIVGALELYFERLNGYAEQDIHTCQLMAGLVTEAIGRESESSLKKSIAAERSSMLAAIEQLKPSLASIADDSAGGALSAEPSNEVAGAARTSLSGGAQDSSRCSQCGEPLVRDEQFCGKCGTPQLAAGPLPETQDKVFAESPLPSGKLPEPDLRSDSLHPFFAPPTSEAGLDDAAARVSKAEEGDTREVLAEISSSDQEPEPSGLEPKADQPLVKTEAQDLSRGQVAADTHQHWTSAAKAREFLEGLTGSRSQGALARFFRARRGDLYLAIALIFIALVIRWGVISSHPSTAPGTAVSKAARRKPAPDADLSTFDKILIGMGLAEAPEAPETYKGNPDTQVWVDLHTALYYCPGSDLYGKTPKGKFTSQRDAQLDQFEPALRKTCN